MPVLLTSILALMIVAALVALECRDLLSAVICVGAVGFLAALAFALMGAPDLAITQVAVEILGLVILIPATIRRDRVDTGGRRRLVPTLAAVLLGTAAIGRLLAGMPAFGLPVMERFADAPSRWFLGEGHVETGAANIVTAILLDYRAYDTLGEVSVLFCAVLGVAAILRGGAKTGGAP
jgi:multisubunit Na+/H+ antiporter MnhB subunit